MINVHCRLRVTPVVAARWVPCLLIVGCLACSQQAPARAPADLGLTAIPDSSALAKAAIDSLHAALRDGADGNPVRVVGFKRDAAGIHIQLELSTEEPTFGGGARVEFDANGRFISIELHQ